MAIVRNLEEINLERNIEHTEVECTYTIVRERHETFLQIDTYGSKSRKNEGKKSQSIRFSQEAIAQLKEIINTRLNF